MVRGLALAAVCASLALATGCNFWRHEKAPDAAAQPAKEKKNWLNMNNYRDPRAVEVENHLGG
jgi:hypothetical protein